MVKRDNPAGRLYEILSEARQLPNMVTTEVWTRVLRGEPGNKTDIMRRISLLQELLDEVKIKISNIEEINTQLYLSRFEELEAVVKATNLNAGWDGYKSHLNEAAMLNLAHCAEALSRYDENLIDESEILELLKNIDVLSEKLRKGSISKPLKETILDLLETMRRSISEYRIRGAEGMKREFAYCLGVFLQNHTQFKKEESKEEINTLGKIFSKFSSLITFALKLKELGFDFDKIIGLIENKQ
jgi:hypothetical protein